MICSSVRTIVIQKEAKFQSTSAANNLFLFYANQKDQRQKPSSVFVKAKQILVFKLVNMPMEQFSKTSGGGGGDSPSALILTSGASGSISALFSARALKSLIMLINAFVLLFLLPFQKPARTAAMAAEKPKDEKMLQQESRMVRLPAIIVPWRSGASSGGGGCSPVDHEVAARRALAARRVLQDDDPNCVREFSLFTTTRGDTLFTQSWTLLSVKIRGLVLLMHGLNEHSGRYSDFAKHLNARGFKVYGIDWVGHGGSDGLHAYVHSLDDAVTDLKSFLDKVLTENPGLPCFCFGHSTGAAIVLKTIMDPKVEARVAGVVLTSPAVGVQPSHPIFVVLAPVFSFLWPRFQLSAANKKGMPVSRDPEALVAKYSDPLVYTGSIRVRTGYEILRIATFLQQNLKRVRLPFLVLHGTADTVTDPAASQKLYDEASSIDKSIKLFDGFLHDLLFEPERQDIVNDITEWMNCRV